jgi:hypothetical protein
MSGQSRHQPAASKKAWYLKWWVWLIAALVVIGGIGALINPGGDGTTEPTASTQTPSSDPTPSETPTEVAPLDIEAFLTDTGVTFKSAKIAARKAYVYVPTETTNEQAQQIAEDTMTYVCAYAKSAGDKFPAVNRVEVSDGVSPVTKAYHAADHPSGFATDDTCQG